MSDIKLPSDNLTKILNSHELLSAYSKKLAALFIYSLPDKVLHIDRGIVTRINIHKGISPQFYISLMDIQEKYKIHYILDCYVYDADIFTKITTCKYIYIMYIKTLINITEINRVTIHGSRANRGINNPLDINTNDTRFIFNEHIHHVSLLNDFEIDTIAYIISNTKIESMNIKMVSIHDLHKVFQSLHNSNLRRLKIIRISPPLMGNALDVITEEMTNSINSIINAINAAPIKLKTLILPKLYLIQPNTIIEALLKNIQLYNTMEKLVLVGILNQTNSTIMGQLIINSSLTKINIYKCGVDNTIWNIINNPQHKDSYLVYRPLKLSLPSINMNIGDDIPDMWTNVKNMLINNIRVNNLIMRYCQINSTQSAILAEGLLKNMVITSITIDTFYNDPFDPVDFHVIFSNIINRKVHLEKLHIAMFYYKNVIWNQLQYMLHNNWLKKLSIIDDTDDYDSDYPDPLSNEDIIDILSLLKNNQSLEHFYLNTSNMDDYLNSSTIQDINDDLINNSTLLKCVIGDRNMAAAQRNTNNLYRKTLSLQDIMYNSIDNKNIIHNSQDKQFIAHYINSNYK